MKTFQSSQQNQTETGKVRCPVLPNPRVGSQSACVMAHGRTTLVNLYVDLVVFTRIAGTS